MRREGKRVILIVVQDMGLPCKERAWFVCRSLAEEGWEVLALCPRSPEATPWMETLHGVRLYRFPKIQPQGGLIPHLIEYFFSGLFTLCYTFLLFFIHRFSILHVVTPPDFYSPLFLLMKNFGVRCIMDIHDLSPELAQAKFPTHPRLASFLEQCEKMTVSLSDQVLVHNQACQERLIQRTGLSPRQVHLYIGAIDKLFLSPTEKDFQSSKKNTPTVRELWKKEKGRDFRFVVLHRSMVESIKGVFEFVELAERLVHQRGREDLLFVQIGDGSLYHELQREIHQKKLDAYFCMTGFISPPRLLYQTIQGADVCVGLDHPSDYTHLSTPVKYLEYVALGKPILLFELKGNRDLLQDATLYVPPLNMEALTQQLLFLLDSPALQSRLIERCRFLATHQLSWNYQKTLLLKAYR